MFFRVQKDPTTWHHAVNLGNFLGFSTARIAPVKSSFFLSILFRHEMDRHFQNEQGWC